MHILITADTVGGVWTYARELVTGLVRRNHCVTLVSFGKLPTQEQTKWMNGLPHFDFYPTNFRLEWMLDAGESVAESRAFVQDFVQRVRPDILHFNQFCYGDLQFGAPRIVVGHSDVFSWWKAVHGNAPDQSEWITWYHDVVTRGLQGASVVVAPSNWMKQVLQSHYSFSAPVRVIYNGESPELFEVRRKTKAALTVGRMWDKGKQANLLLQREHDVPVWIAGCEQDAGESFSREGTKAAAVFYGQQSEEQLRDLFSRASTYVAASRYEPFGLAPLEAAFSGCAVIANDIPSFREIWGDSALYFRRNDSASLADAIRTFHQNDGLRTEYARHARSHALQHYTADRMLDRYEQLYRELSVRSAAA